MSCFQLFSKRVFKQWEGSAFCHVVTPATSHASKSFRYFRPRKTKHAKNCGGTPFWGRIGSFNCRIMSARDFEPRFVSKTWTAEYNGNVLAYCTILCRKLLRHRTCLAWKQGLVSLTQSSESFVNCKTRGKLLHLTTNVFNLVSSTEKHSESTFAYEQTLDEVMDTFHLSFHCATHKIDITAVLHYYISVRMRQYCKQNMRAEKTV